MTVYWPEDNTDDIQVFDVDWAQVYMKEFALNCRTTYSIQLCRQEYGGLSFGEAAEASAPPEATDNQPEQPDQEDHLSTIPGEPSGDL